VTRALLSSTVSEAEDQTRFTATVDIAARAETQERLEWAAANVGSPAIESVEVEGEAETVRFVFEPVDGTPANRPEHRFEPDVTMRLIGECARSLHDTPVGDCPVGPSMRDRAEAVADRFADDDRPLEPPYHRVTRQRLAQVVLDGLPEDPAEPSVCHGRLDMSQVIICKGRSTVLGPPLGLTVADRHLDVATLVRSLSQAGPGELIAATMESYGWGVLAAPRLDWFDMLTVLESLEDPESPACPDSSESSESAATPE